MNTDREECFQITRYTFNKIEQSVRIEEGVLYKEFASITAMKRNESDTKTEEDGHVYQYTVEINGHDYPLCTASEEGMWYRNTFWLKKRDDKKAKQIINDRYSLPKPKATVVSFNDL